MDGEELRHGGGLSIRASKSIEVQGRAAARNQKAGDLHVAAFVQNERTGDVLQALSLPVCR